MSGDVVGSVFGGRWKIERPLAAGGMGAVYVANHADTGRRVALKLIKDDGAKSPELVARFRKETGALAAVSHPNVVTFLDSGVEEGTFYLVMELLEGRPLRAVMGAPLPWKRAFRIGADVCRALSAVHKAGIIHRDLKPENIFLQDAEGHDEIAKLIDFGIVRLHDRQSATMTKSGAVVGTPGYIAPEQLQGQDASPASDVYAVGVILYELVTGKFPFEAPTPHAMLVRQLIEPLIPPRQALDTVPAHVEKVILRFMDRDPSARVRTAKDALAVLIEALGFIDSLAPSAPTELGDEISDAAKRVLAFNTADAASSLPSSSPPSSSSSSSSSSPPVLAKYAAPVPPDRATAPTGTVIPPVTAPIAPVDAPADAPSASAPPATRPTPPARPAPPPPGKQRSSGEKLLLAAGITLLAMLGTCGTCVMVGVAKSCGGRGDNGDHADNGDNSDNSDGRRHRHDLSVHADDVDAPSGVAPSGVATSATPPTPPIPEAHARKKARAKLTKSADGKGKVDVNFGENAHFTLDGVDLKDVPPEAFDQANDDDAPLPAPPPPAFVKKLVNAAAPAFAMCGGTKKPVPLKITLDNEGALNLESKASDTKASAPALECAASILDELDGPDFKGKPVTVTVPVILGGG